MTTRDKVRELLAQGLSTRQIATVLGISTQATWKHLKNIREEEAQR